MAEEKKTDFKANLGMLADKMKNTQVTTPMQKVVPVVTQSLSEKDEKPEAQLNVWIPKDLLKKMKRRGLDADMSLKEMTIKALEIYLDK